MKYTYYKIVFVFKNSSRSASINLLHSFFSTALDSSMSLYHNMGILLINCFV